MEEPRNPQPFTKLTLFLTRCCIRLFLCIFTQSPSFLSHQRTLRQRHTRSNAQTLFALDKIPTDNPIRNILDAISVDNLLPVFKECLAIFEKDEHYKNHTSLDGNMLIALDGTQFFSSKNIHGDCCSKTACESGTVYSHKFVGASLCNPYVNKILPLEPEFITPQDGHDKHDCENAPAKRWLEKHGSYYASKKAIILGDDLYAHNPLLGAIITKNLSYIVVCKEDSHKYLYDFIDKAPLDTILANGAKGTKIQVRFMTDVPLNGQKDSLIVNWVEIIESDKKGKQLYKNCFVTNLSVTRINALSIALRPCTMEDRE